MTTICRMPASSPVIAALEKAEAADLQAGMLFQVEDPGAAALRAASREDPLDPIAITAKELLLVRSKLNRLVNERVNWSRNEASRLGNEFLTDLFGQTVPGPVTLPLDGRASLTVNAAGLTQLFLVKNGFYGVVSTVDDAGRPSKTRAFYTDGDGVTFAEHNMAP